MFAAVLALQFLGVLFHVREEGLSEGKPRAADFTHLIPLEAFCAVYSFLVQPHIALDDILAANITRHQFSMRIVSVLPVSGQGVATHEDHITGRANVRARVPLRVWHVKPLQMTLQFVFSLEFGGAKMARHARL